tara:strand:+ start:775 stop:948 length:174 start_codon:yes stop_codon:yes gene_type:complete
LAKLIKEKIDYFGGYFTPQVSYPLTVEFQSNYWSEEWDFGKAGYILAKTINVKNQLK